MAESKPRNQWFEQDDTSVIKAMLSNNSSEYWERCREFVRYYVNKQFSNLEVPLKEEAVQETLLSVHKSLAAFRQQSKLITWVSSIAYHRAIDILRRQTNIGKWEVHADDTSESQEDNLDVTTICNSRTPEEIALTNENIQETFVEIEMFLQKHAKPERNRQILQMVLYDGYSQEDTAHLLGIPAPVIGYVVRSAREHLRQKLSHLPKENDKQK